MGDIEMRADGTVPEAPDPRVPRWPGRSGTPAPDRRGRAPRRIPRGSRAPTRPVLGRARLALHLVGGLAAALLALAPASAAAETSEPVECLIEPRHRVKVATPVEGRVEEIRVDRGDRVKAGEVVAVLDSGVERATLKVDEARVEFGRRRLERHEEMFREAVISEGKLDLVREEQRVAELERDRSRAVLERRRIRSPIDGVVVRRLLEPGEFADPPEIVEIAQIDPLRVEAFVPAAHFGRIREGDRAAVRPELGDGEAREAVVVAVDPLVDPASGTFGVRLELPNAAHEIPAGLKCQVRFDLAPAAAPADMP